MRLLKAKKSWLGIGVSILSLVIVVHGIDYDQVLEAFKAVSLPHLLLAMVWLLATFSVMALRWRYLLLPVKAVRVGPLLAMIIIGYFFNSILPARAGEVVRAYLLGRKENCSAVAVLATVVLEKVLDGLSLLLFLAFSLLLIPAPPWMRSIGYLAGLIFLGCLIVLLGLTYWSEPAMGFLGAILSPLGPISDKVFALIRSFTQGLESLRQPKAALMAMLLSLLVWTGAALMFGYGLLSFDIRLSVGAVIFITAVVNLGLVVPASPGYLGTYQLLVVAALAVFAVDRNLGLAFALLFHASQFLLNIFLGLALFWREALIMEGTPWQALREDGGEERGVVIPK
jgi:hypothetical protein